MNSFLKFLIFFLIGAIVGFFFCKWVIGPKEVIVKPPVIEEGERELIQWMPANSSDWSEKGREQVRDIIAKVEGRVAAINAFPAMNTDQTLLIKDLFGNNGKLTVDTGKTIKKGDKIARYFDKMLQEGTVITNFEVSIEYILAYELTHIVNKEPKLDSDRVHSIYFVFNSAYTMDDGSGRTIKIDPPGGTTYWHTRICDDDNDEEEGEEN